MTRFPLATFVFLLLAGCAGQLNDIGVAPTMTAVGHSSSEYLGVDPGLKSVARASPRPMDARYDSGSTWQSGPTSLFGDRRARQLGDILTIVIDISDQAQINNSTNRARSGSESLSVPNLLGIPQILNQRLPEGADLNSAVGLSSNSSASGNGSVARQETITLRVAATVVEVLSNGHLVVQGNQEIRVNYELRDLQLAGIVRPEDISRRNEITYDKIAGARISYGGRGQISNMQQARPGQQALDAILPF
jgi:flagellar L-ring protein precursor FlgH